VAERYDETEAALRLLPARLTAAADVTCAVESSRSHSAVKCFVRLSSEMEHDDADFSYLGIFDGRELVTASCLPAAADGLAYADVVYSNTQHDTCWQLSTYDTFECNQRNLPVCRCLPSMTIISHNDNDTFRVMTSLFNTV